MNLTEQKITIFISIIVFMFGFLFSFCYIPKIKYTKYEDEKKQKRMLFWVRVIAISIYVLDVFYCFFIVRR